MTMSRFATGTLIAALGCTAWTADAAIVAGFEQQVTTNTTFFSGNNTGDATAPDQWGGTAGDGWTSGWIVDTGGSVDRRKRVTDIGDLFSGTGNHLRFESSATSSFRRWANVRNYDTGYAPANLTPGGVATFEFLYRADKTNTFANGGTSFVEIKEGGGDFENTNTTWFITTTGGTSKRWLIGDGNLDGTTSTVDSGLTIVEGQTFKFTIVSDPTAQTYDITIDNLQDENPAFSATDLGYRQNVTEHAGRLVFNHQVTGGETNNEYDYSLDSISISGPAPDPVIPEPASAALVALGGLALMGRRRKH